MRPQEFALRWRIHPVGGRVLVVSKMGAVPVVLVLKLQKIAKLGALGNSLHFRKLSSNFKRGHQRCREFCLLRNAFGLRVMLCSRQVMLHLRVPRWYTTVYCKCSGSTATTAATTRRPVPLAMTATTRTRGITVVVQVAVGAHSGGSKR